MRLQLPLLAAAVCLFSSLFAQENQTPTYSELIQAYTELANANPGTVKMIEEGTTDCGIPLHTVVISSDGLFDADKAHESGKLVCLIMNGIHPGEACGINASLTFATNQSAAPNPDVVYVIIPIYNIGGALNRGSFSRANQDGPEEHGFRGNAQNLDLNRDFIKSDSRNAVSFAKIFHKWNPEIFVDTHTSNGADYQPTLTLLTTFPEKFDKFQSTFLSQELDPALYAGMRKKNDEMVPYVYATRGTPDNGISAFTDYPRYSIGYAALFNTIGFTTEAHMLKTFDARVTSTLNFLDVLDETMTEKHKVIIDLKKLADKADLTRTTYQTDWQVSGSADSLMFPGFSADTLTSDVTGLPRLFYDRSKPYRKNIPYYRYHESQQIIDLPSSYVLSAPNQKVLELLEANNVAYSSIDKDTTISVLATYIQDFETVKNPYEAHYAHKNTKVRTRPMEVDFRKGDVIISAAQPASKYLAEIFHPQCNDSFFNWNFYDSFLQQKEYFSPYVFEDTAAEILRKDKNLRKAFEEKTASDSTFAQSSWEQLYFIYTHSPYYEQTHKRMPVYYIK